MITPDWLGEDCWLPGLCCAADLWPEDILCYPCSSLASTENSIIRRLFLLSISIVVTKSRILSLTLWPRTRRRWCKYQPPGCNILSIIMTASSLRERYMYTSCRHLNTSRIRCTTSVDHKNQLLISTMQYILRIIFMIRFWSFGPNLLREIFTGILVWCHVDIEK